MSYNEHATMSSTNPCRADIHGHETREAFMQHKHALGFRESL